MPVSFYADVFFHVVYHYFTFANKLSLDSHIQSKIIKTSIV